MKSILKKKEAGVSLLLTFLILSVIFSIAIAFSGVVLREFKITRGASHSYRAIYIADAGAEKMQYIIFRIAGIWETTGTSTTGVVSGGGVYNARSEELDLCAPSCTSPADEEIDKITSDGIFRDLRRKIEINLLP